MIEHRQRARRCKTLRILLPTLLLAVVTTLLIASGTPGPQFQVNTFTPSGQVDPAVVMDSAGNFVIAWTSDAQDGDGFGVFAQRFDASGQPVGPEFQVNTFTAGFQTEPTVAMDAAGNFIVAWTSESQDGDGLGVFAQRFDATGNRVGTEFRVNTTTAGNQSGPALAMNPSGNLVIAWSSGPTFLVGAAEAVFAQRFDSIGTPIGSEFRVNTSGGDIFDKPTVAMDAAGNFVVSWTGVEANNPFAKAVLAQRYHAAGVPQGTEFQINVLSDARRPTTGMDQDGNFVVAWETSNSKVDAQRFDASGGRLGSVFQVNTFSLFGERPVVGMNPTGNFVIGALFDDGEDPHIFAQCYNADGTPQGNEFQVNDPSSFVPSRRNPAASMDATGNFVIAWTGRDADQGGVFARRYAAVAAGPSLSIDDVSVVEGDSGMTSATFTITLSAQSTQTVTADFATADGTALSGDDYQANFGTLTFALGETSKQITVQVNGDARHEPNETFFVNLSNASNASILRGRGIGTILNDDFTLSIGDAVPVTEGSSGTIAAVFSVGLSGDNSQTHTRAVTVEFASADGTATVADNDYVANSGTLTFNPGETSKEVAVLINGDTRNEFDETFFVNLSNSTNATIADGQGKGVIRNDDFASTSAGNQFQVNTTFFGNQFQPAIGMNNAGSFVISWTGAVTDTSGFIIGTGIFARRFDSSGIVQGPDFRVDEPGLFSTPGHPAVAMDADGNFVAVWDTVGGSSVATESANTTSDVYARRFRHDGTALGTNFRVNITGNIVGHAQHPDVGVYASGEFVITWETPDTGGGFDVFLKRFDANGNPLPRADGVVACTNVFTGQPESCDILVNSYDNGFQGHPKVAVNPAECLGGAGSCSLNGFVIVWEGAGPDDDAGIFARRLDANGIPSGDQFRVNMYTNNIQEQPTVSMDAQGNFVVAWEGEGLAFPNGPTVRGIFAQRFDSNATALGWCNPLPPGPVLCTISDLQVSLSTTNVHRPAVGVGSKGDFVISWDGFEPSTSQNSAIFARSFDRFGVAQGGNEFLVNQTFPLGDFDPEVRMDSGGNFVIAWVGSDFSLSGILARRFAAAPTISINDFRENEGDSGTKNWIFTVTLSVASTRPVSVGFATADGTAAVADSDYVVDSGTLTFAPGDTSKTITVMVNGDTTPEADETFFVNLSNPVNAVIARSQGVGNIVNDDCALSIRDVTVTEGNSGTASAVFTVNLACTKSQTVTVDFATADGTATVADNDYVANSGTLTFAPGETSKQITVLVNGDTTAEPDETFFVNLSNATNATIAKAQDVGTITNDDAVQIVVNETIHVTDTPGVLPSAMIDVAENIVVTDVPGVLPSAMIGIAENIVVTDAPQVFNTASGTNIMIMPRDLVTLTSPVTLTFANVTQPGNTTLVISAVGPPQPSGFGPGTPPRYYDVSTTAVFTGNTQVCVSYASISFRGVPSLWHFENGTWLNITTSVDTANKIVCGNATSLSPFALFAPADATPPLIAPNVSGTAGNNGWYRSDILVSWSVTDPESAISSSSGCQATPVTSDTAGTTFTCTAASAGGTASNSVTIKRDATPPSIAITTPLRGAVYVLNQAVAASYACTDNLSGVANCAGPVSSGANLDTATAGTKNFTVNSTDAAGNITSQSVSYQVLCHYVTITLSPSTVRRGGTITVTGKLMSCASTTQTVVVQFTLTGPLPRGSCASTNSVMFTTPPITLPPNTLRNVSFPFRVPTGICPGTYSVTARTLVGGNPVDTSTTSLTVTP